LLTYVETNLASNRAIIGASESKYSPEAVASPRKFTFARTNIGKTWRLIDLYTASSLVFCRLSLGELTTSHPVGCATLASSAAAANQAFFTKFAALLVVNAREPLFGIIARASETVIIT